MNKNEGMKKQKMAVCGSGRKGYVLLMRKERIYMYLCLMDTFWHGVSDYYRMGKGYGMFGFLLGTPNLCLYSNIEYNFCLVF